MPDTDFSIAFGSREAHPLLFASVKLHDLMSTTVSFYPSQYFTLNSKSDSFMIVPYDVDCQRCGAVSKAQALWNLVPDR